MRFQEQIISFIREKVAAVDIVLVSDYAKGLVSPALMEQIVMLCRKAGKRVVVSVRCDGTPVGEFPIRQRELEYDSEAQVGRASIPTSLREFELQVTAENSETPNQPSDLLVASQKVREN